MYQLSVSNPQSLGPESHVLVCMLQSSSSQCQVTRFIIMNVGAVGRPIVKIALSGFRFAPGPISEDASPDSNGRMTKGCTSGFDNPVRKP
jgi:hypothetical protein